MHIAFTKGFTLAELLVTVSLISVILAFGVPGFQSMVRDNRLAAHSSRVVTALNLARSEAVKRGQQVTVCRATLDGGTPKCTDAPCGDGSFCWENGWLVFADANGNGVLNDGTDPNFCVGEDCTIQIFEALPSGLTLRTGNNIKKWIAYQSPGTAKGSNGLANDTFRLCQEADKAHARSIVVNGVGRARVDQGADQCP